MIWSKPNEASCDVCSVARWMMLNCFESVPNYLVDYILYLIILFDTYFAVTNKTSEGQGDKCPKCDISKWKLKVMSF